MAERAEKAKEARRAARRAALMGIVRWGARGGLAFLALLALWGSLEVRARVQAEPRFDLSRWELELGDLPPWAPEEMRSELAALAEQAAFEEPLSVFTPRVLEKVRRRILASSWVREVPRLHLRYPGLPQRRGRLRAALSANAPGAEEVGDGGTSGQGGIELELELRRPIAAVAAGGHAYLTDHEGVRLGPAIDEGRPRVLRIPLISGGESRSPRRPPPPGVAWEDRDVREGLEVARILWDAGIHDEFPEAPIHAIDIAGVGRRARPGECEVFLAAGDLRLGWGRSPLSPGARTLSVPEVLENLRRILRNHRSLPSAQRFLLYTSPPVAAEVLPPRS
jgi:hypothetical protein